MTMKFKFKKKYKSGTSWIVPLTDFLECLSTKYGYTIDSFDLLALPELLVQERLGELYNKNPRSRTYNQEFIAQLQKTMQKKEYAAEARQRARECWEARNIFEGEDK